MAGTDAHLMPTGVLLCIDICKALKTDLNTLFWEECETD